MQVPVIDDGALRADLDSALLLAARLAGEVLKLDRLEMNQADGDNRNPDD
jgi:hypothetical protein